MRAGASPPLAPAPGEDHTGALSGTIGMRSIGPPSFSCFTFRYCKKHANCQKTAQAGRFIPKNKKMCRIFGTSEIDDKPPGSFRKKSARGCMFMGNKQIKEIRFGKLGGSQSLFLSSRGARPFF